MDGEVSAAGVALLEPGSDGRVCDDVLAGGELSTELLRECDEPVDGFGGAAVEGAEVLVVNLSICVSFRQTSF